MSQLLCPKCHNVMTRYERNRVHVDQCPECGGLFLDRGELEHLIQAEAAYYAQPGSPVPTAPPPPTASRDDRDRYRDRDRDDDRDRYRDRDRDDDRDRYRDRDDDRSYRRKRKARSFLDDLLDF